MLFFDKPEMQFGATTFFAKQHKGETCGSNGLPLTPNSITICGLAQALKLLKHPFLCEYLDFIRGKHERTTIVSQYCGTPLYKFIGVKQFTFDEIKQIGFQIIQALDILHENKIVHRNLSTSNVLMQTSGNIKLFNYGLYYMTNQGKLVLFPISELPYSSPEVLLSILEYSSSNYKVDIWSVGIILLELVINKPLWSSLKLGQKIRKILSLSQCTSSIFEKIAREHNCYDTYENTPDDLKELIENCLQIKQSNRPKCKDILQYPIFKSFFNQNRKNPSKVCEPFKIFTLKELYHFWQLAGGDVFIELKKQGLIRTTPPILSLPCLVLLDGTSFGQVRNPLSLYDPKVVQMPLDGLYQRLSHISLSSYYPLIHTKSKIIEESEPPPYDAEDLPLVIKEKDPEYQFHRIILFRRLLHGDPFTKDLIRQEALKDIPPLLRGEIWVSLLKISPDYKKKFIMIDKETTTTTDRQIEVDIPRCHQYNELLSSPEGHIKLKRVLKAWIREHSQYVYWQGLDSLTAPFLYLNFNDEAKAYACLSAFVPKYVHNFFLKDNSAVIQEYLAKFSQLIAFHEPELANHLHDINFYPELFAIPWFLTVFSHVFPLYKILHLWDQLLLSDSSFPLHIGLSVLTQLKEKLLSAGFNDCILLFSDLPDVDIEKSVKYSTLTFCSTPRSITSRNHENEQLYTKTEYDITNVTVQELNKERCPRISAKDVIKLVRNNRNSIVIIDIRSPTEFMRCSINGSINIPFSSLSFSEYNIENIGPHADILKNKGDKIVIIVGTEETDLDSFPKFLLSCGISKVCILHGGFNILLPVTPTILITQNN